MDIIKTNILSESQQLEINKLQQAAYKKHGLMNSAWLSNEINYDRSIPCFFMGYVGERLVSFLSLFLPTRQEAEVVAFTHPDFQRKGCFSLLLEEAEAVLRRAKINTVVFAIETKSRSGMAVLKTFPGAKYDRSEYRMRADYRVKVPDSNGTRCFEVDQSNKELFRTALALVFPDSQDRNNFYDAVVNSDLRRGYIIYRDRPIGVFNIGIEDGDSFIYGVGIASEYRGMGYGKKLMGHAMREGLRFSKNLVLDVDSENPVALSLYKKCGFAIDFQVDYYRFVFPCA